MRRFGIFIFAVSIVGLLIVGRLCICTDDVADANRMVGVQDSDVSTPQVKVSQEPTLIRANGRFEDENAEKPEATDLEDDLVDAFDDLTDKWMEGSRSVTMANVEMFVATFRKVPKARQDECIHRALNLIPDENVMLLAGILMDKTIDGDIVETVYNDILNRDEGVKNPILLEIFKDKTHPCWADTAWILEATGLLPENE